MSDATRAPCPLRLPRNHEDIRIQKKCQRGERTRRYNCNIRHDSHGNFCGVETEGTEFERGPDTIPN